MNQFLSFSLFLACTLTLSSCTPENIRPGKEPAASFGNKPTMVSRENMSTIGIKGGPAKICGMLVASDFIASQQQDIGNLLISNDKDSVYVSIVSQAKSDFTSCNLFLGDASQIPLDHTGKPDANLFPHKKNFPLPVHLRSFGFARASLDSCIMIIVRVEATSPSGSVILAWSSGFLAPGTNLITGNDYCMQDCNGMCTKDLRTQSQAEWGATIALGSPAEYMHANWAKVFPSGITIGCQAGYTLSLLSAQAASDFLPSGGNLMVLIQNSANPGSQVQNPLAAEVVTLTLTTGFDYFFPAFGASNENIADMKIVSGPFQGWTVNQVLSEANNAIGGCGSQHTLAELYDVLGKINSNYLSGQVDNGFLTCM